MAPIVTELATLRALTFRISSTATSNLPQHVPAIAASLATCRTLLSSNQSAQAKSSSEASVAIHKYRTLLVTLLQDRTFHGRWAATVLIKTTIEIGGWETLQKSLPWVRGLLGVLSKPDPPSSKKLCIITLTRLFSLTREYPTLVREITTPSLPTFIQACLNIASSRIPADLLQTIIESFSQLLPRHPAVFRSYLKQLRQILAQAIAPTPSNRLSPEEASLTMFIITSEVSAAAQRLYVQLPYCAPKGASTEDWQQSLNKIIQASHTTADIIFRAVIEEWTPDIRRLAVPKGQTLDDEVHELDTNAVGSPLWSGIFAGGERLHGLLGTILAHVENATAAPISLHIGALIDLLSRLLSLTLPSSTSKGFHSAVKSNNQVSREERESLWLILPGLHAAALKILLSLLHRCEASASAIDTVMLDHIELVFSSEKHLPECRTACYLTIAKLLGRSGITFPKSFIDPLGSMIRACCDDILPLEASINAAKQPTQTEKSHVNNQQALTNADTFLNTKKVPRTSYTSFAGLQGAANTLLPVLLTCIRAGHLSESLRSRMDRTAILTGHKDAMVASVLNPTLSRKFGRSAASILPLLARTCADTPEVEALLRPRMPVIKSGGQAGREGDSGDEIEEEEEEVESEVEADGVDELKDGNDRFAGEALEKLLGPAVEVHDADKEKKDTGAEIAPLSSNLEHMQNYAAGNQAAPRKLYNFELPKGAEKRTQEEEDVSIATVKRVKFNGQARSPPLSQFSEIQPVATAIPTASADASGGVVIVSSSTTMIPATTSHAAEASVEQGENSDDEDIVSLVLGPDTDEESDQ